MYAFLYYLRFHRASFPILVATLIIKIFYSFVLLYFVINRWDFGDLATYYSLAHYLKYSDYTLFTGPKFIAQLHSVIFYVLGTSLFGLTLLSACVAHLAFTLIAGKVYEASEIHKKNNSIFWINVLPIVSMQSTYIGREPWILLITALFFYCLNSKVVNKFWIACLLLIVLFTRPYHAAILGASLGTTLLLFYTIINLRILLMVILFIPFAIYAISRLSVYLDSIISVGFIDFLNLSYKGGNQIYEPYPFPFTVLQLFRPMPWDSSEPYMIVASLENIFVLFLALQLGWLLARKNPMKLKKYGISLIFMLVFTMIYGCLFMYSENVGDLSRRHVYYYPFIIFAYFKLYQPLLKSRLGKIPFT